MLTQRWRKVDSNLRAPDYGEPSGAREVAHAARRRGDQGRAVGDESASRNRKFESTPLQRRVHKPPVPQAAEAMADDEGALAQLGIRKGQIAEGTALLGRGLTVWEEGGGRVGSPYLKSVLAEGMAELGNITRALDLVDEAIVQIGRPGWEERYYYAEVLRIRGWLLSLRGDPAAAERAYIASLDWARQQQAKSWELRTATSYARLMRDHGRVGEAYKLLAPVYEWFTEGFATKDLKDAKALLEELADAQALLASEGLTAEGVNAERA